MSVQWNFLCDLVVNHFIAIIFRTHQSRLQFEKSTLRVTEKLRHQTQFSKQSSEQNFNKMLKLLGGDPVKQYSSIKPYILESSGSSSDLSSGIIDPRAPFYDPCTSSYTQSKHVASILLGMIIHFVIIDVLEYLSNPEVEEALHVGASSLRGKLGYSGWSQCHDEINERWSFADFLADTTYLYSRIYNHPLKPKSFKMLVFSGDNDGVSFHIMNCSSCNSILEIT